MDRLKAMHTFVQIADRGSLTKAANALETSLPAVVRALAALEAHLGVRLFHRTTRRIALTEEGAIYLERAREVLAAADAADRMLAAGAAEPAGQLTITAPVLFGHMHVSPAVVRFLHDYPRMRCSVLLHDRVVNLLDEGVDVGVRIGALADSTLVARPVGRIRRVVVVSPSLLRRHGPVAHPRDLAGAEWVRVQPTAPVVFREDGRAISLVPRGRLDFNHVAPAVEACAAGMGFGVFLHYQVAPLVVQRRLAIVLEDFEPAPSPVHLVYPHARLLPARTRVFIDWMAAALGAQHA